MKRIFMLAEGPHDTAFLYRILKANGLKQCKRKVKEYPVPFDGFLTHDLVSNPIEELKLTQGYKKFLPSFVFEKKEEQDQEDGHLIFIYSLGGDSQKSVRQVLFDTLNAYPDTDDDPLNFDPVSIDDIIILYFLDADDKGTKTRLDNISEELMEHSEVTNNVEIKRVEEFYKVSSVRVGVYIFSDEEDKGALENVLLPLMKQENEEVFNSAETFLESNKEKQSKKFNLNKSLIGTVGQLQKSGSSNVVCIQQADFLTDEKILQNSECRKIYNFVDRAIQL